MRVRDRRYRLRKGVRGLQRHPNLLALWQPGDLHADQWHGAAFGRSPPLAGEPGVCPNFGQGFQPKSFVSLRKLPKL